MPETIMLVNGTANPAFTGAIHGSLQTESVKARLIETAITAFPDGETKVRIRETVRGYDIYLIQPTRPPVNENLMRLCIMLDALKRASARSITAIVPYFGYSRQERKDVPRAPITAKLAAQFIETAGAHRVVTMDLHAPAIQGFFDIPVDDLKAAPVFANALKQILGDLNDVVIVAPDIGGVERARNVAEELHLPLAIIEARRDTTTGKKDILNIIGEVYGKRPILVDDIVATGKTLADDAWALRDEGAKETRAVVTHGVFIQGAMDIIENSCLQELLVTDTIPAKDDESPKIKRISIAPVFADAIRRIHENRSLSAMLSPAEPQ